ncbi:hypothetical protein JB92DRAFT_3123876 [Gautieria morchelliformis]|nr:hypothetical protein JB92DRAFT_3123876 [Gautieria morchelliformis]
MSHTCSHTPPPSEASTSRPSSPAGGNHMECKSVPCSEMPPPEASRSQALSTAEDPCPQVTSLSRLCGPAAKVQARLVCGGLDHIRAFLMLHDEVCHALMCSHHQAVLEARFPSLCDIPFEPPISDNMSESSCYINHALDLLEAEGQNLEEGDDGVGDSGDDDEDSWFAMASKPMGGKKFFVA